MSRRCPERSARHAAPTRRTALTLLELLIATSVMLLIVGTLAGLAQGVQMAFEHGEAYGTITQHARVVLQRITRTVNQAAANDHFPGFLVIAEYDGTYRFPDTLVVWRRSSPPTATTLPSASELVIYCPDPDSPKSLLEITATSDTTQMPSLDPTDSSYTANLAIWKAKVAALKASSNATKSQLTPRMRTARVPGYSKRGMVRFESRYTPSDELLTTKTWAELQPYCVQGIYGPNGGLRQAWLRFEIQLQPVSSTNVTAEEGLYAVPFFGSAAVYYLTTP
jgi:hypothetical protein